VKDGWIFGRGANDDKAALAVELFLAKAFRELGITLKNDIVLGGYVDEEFGGGNGALALCLKHRADFAINIDSDYMDVIHCGVGGQRLAIVLRHPEPQDNCGIVMEGLYLAKREIDKFGARRCAELAENPYFAGTPIPKKALRYMNIVSGTKTNDRHLGTLDFAFYTDRDTDTIKAELDELLARIRERIAPLGLVLDEVILRSRLFRYAATDKGHPEIARLQKHIREVAKKEPAVCGMCLSDLNIFINNLNGNAVSCGVCLGFADEGGAHQPDERVSCAELVDLTKTISSFIWEWDKV
jgi:acetylornithine deacetylase/succinyl-diaminopimelate desuccinylase-like protein